MIAWYEEMMGMTKKRDRISSSTVVICNDVSYVKEEPRDSDIQEPNLIRISHASRLET